MATNDLNIYAAEPTAVGSIYAGPLDAVGPALPDPFSELDSDFVNLGDVGEDGFNETTDRKNDKKRNFGGKVVKVLQTEFGKTIELVFLESLNADVLKAIHGTKNVIIVPATTAHGEIIEVRKNAKRLPHLKWVVDTIDTSLGDDDHPAKYRSYIPNGQIVDTGDVKIVHTDTVEYKVTIEAFADDQGEHIYTWTDNGRVVTI